VTSELHTVELRHLLERFHHGESAAVEELFRRAADRLERLARGMLRKFPQVRQREQTVDLLQESMLSLLAALRQLSFSSTREFYGLAAEHMRRRLLDLHRRYAQPHRQLQQLAQSGCEGERVIDQSASDGAELDRWQALHEAVALLPADQREVFSLRLYHDWSIDEIAALLQVSTRSVTRLWHRAQLQLSEQVGN
jgi:RNA polymerase sigma factor (sigma-70 family)